MGFREWVDRMSRMAGTHENEEAFKEEIKKSLERVKPMVEEMDRRRREVKQIEP